MGEGAGPGEGGDAGSAPLAGAPTGPVVVPPPFVGGGGISTPTRPGPHVVSPQLTTIAVCGPPGSVAIGGVVAIEPVSWLTSPAAAAGYDATPLAPADGAKRFVYTGASPGSQLIGCDVLWVLPLVPS